MRKVFLIVLIVLLIPGNARGKELLTPLLQLITNSALATDRLQTPLWVNGTKENPIMTSPGNYLYETNPYLAGHPERVNSYFDFLGNSAKYLPQKVSPQIANLGLGLAALAELYTITQNNAVAKNTGLPQRWAIGHRWDF